MVYRKFPGPFAEEQHAGGEHGEGREHANEGIAAVGDEQSGDEVEDEGNRNPADEGAE